MTRIRAFTLSALALVGLMGLTGCGKPESAEVPTTQAAQPLETTQAPEETQPTEKELTAEEQAVLQQRRDIAESYARDSLTMLWRPAESLVYGLAERDNGTQLFLIADRLYQGLPYAYGCGTKDAFLEYAGEPDEYGIYTVSGLDAAALDYGKQGARVGNDCSSVVTNAWSLIGTSFTTCMSSTMFEDFGAIPVGDYDFCVPISPETGRITDTAVVTAKNGALTMYTAYAQLQKADAVFRQAPGGGNHTMMVVDVHVEYQGNIIDGTKSYVTVLEQTRTNFVKTVTATHPETGEKIYVIGGVDKIYTFAQLFSSTYLPVTVKELRDPSPVEDAWVKDSETDAGIEEMFTGVISSNMFIDSVYITVTDADGAVVQQVAGRARRRYNKEFDLSRFQTELPGSMKGYVNIDELEAGSYHCTVVARLTDNREFTVRDFDFTK